VGKHTLEMAESSFGDNFLYDMLRHSTLRHARMAPLVEVSAICILQLEAG